MRPTSEAVYVVMVQNEDEAWADLAIVTVPAKTKRRTVIAKALETNGHVLDGGPQSLRVIPAEHAEPIKVEMEQPPPRLRIG